MSTKLDIIDHIVVMTAAHGEPKVSYSTWVLNQSTVKKCLQLSARASKLPAFDPTLSGIDSILQVWILHKYLPTSAGEVIN